MSEDRDPERLTSPRIYLVRMGVFLVLAAFIAFILQAQIVRAFMANPGLNGLILLVLLFGIVLAILQVTRLFPEIAYVNNLGNPIAGGRQPVLLAPMARVIGPDGHADAISTATWRALMDSIATRLDEGREILRYLTGLLIFLGLLGTFWGLLETVASIGSVINAMQGNADSGVMFDDLKNGIARPLAGMSLSFTASLFGLAGSLVMGFLDLQAGQAQNRFYTDLENRLASRAGAASPLPPDAEGLSPEIRAALGKIASAADTTNERAATAAMANLAEGIQALVHHMRNEQQMIRDWAEAQAGQHAEIKRLIDRVAAQKEPQ